MFTKDPSETSSLEHIIITNIYEYIHQKLKQTLIKEILITCKDFLEQV